MFHVGVDMPAAPVDRRRAQPAADPAGLFRAVKQDGQYGCAVARRVVQGPEFEAGGGRDQAFRRSNVWP